MTGAPVLGLLLLAPAAPVPALPPEPVAKADPELSAQFAIVVHQVAERVQKDYVREVTSADLAAGAVRGLYDRVGRAPPPGVLAALRAADTPGRRIDALTAARVAAGRDPAIAWPRDLFAAMNGFRHATDASCGLALPRSTSTSSVEVDYGIGVELEGVYGDRWVLFQLERAFAAGRVPPPNGRLVPPLDAVRSPAEFPWRVRRVVPGSPAQRAGMKPGDVITHLDGTELKPGNADQLFQSLAFPQRLVDPRTGQLLPVRWTFRVRREGHPPAEVKVTTGSTVPESVFGVIRTGETSWDCVLDREYRIGYVRLGTVERESDQVLMDTVDGLVARGCRGLVVDLRWCIGGWIAQSYQIAGYFVPEGRPVSRVEYRNRERGESRTVPSTAGRKCLDLPMVALIGPVTAGGGELIAAALQDNARCPVMGQRTAGSGRLTLSLDAGFAGFSYRMTVGTLSRPNGKPRQRNPDSQPTDDWGVRPDPGLEVPVTPDLQARLRLRAEEHALRPADRAEALPFDDPSTDPYRVAALAYLRKKLGKP